MRWRGRAAAAAGVTAAALLLPAAASAHAYLVHTVPAASVTVNVPPPAVSLTFDEAVEPRFALISVTDVDAHQETSGPLHRSPSNPDTLIVPLKRVPEGWYLVYWRAISVDGHPVQGAFTFAVGPSPGPAPQFTIPHISQTATTTPLLLARWAVFLTVMSAIGLFVLRIVIARPVVQRVGGAELTALSWAFVVASVLSLAAIPVYLEEATAVDSLRSFFAVNDLVPLWRTTAFGRGYYDMELCVGLFCLAGWSAIWLDRPREPRRTVVSLLATTGALGAAAAVLVFPGAAGHAAQTAPRGVSVLLDWLHLVSGSLWLGGLIGLLVLWWGLPAARRISGLIVCVPRFSNVAFVSVLVLLGTGVGASILHLPLVSALWQTSYGKVILIKAALLTATLPLAAVNLLRNKPGLLAAAGDPSRGERPARLLRRLVGGEALLVAAAVFAAALLSSLAPPPPAFAEQASALVKVGPGRVAATTNRLGYELQVLVNPNRAVAPNAFGLRITRNGRPVRGADVTLTFAMLDMQMPQQEYQLTETAPGVYSRTTPALVMVGHWGLSFNVTPKGGEPFTALIVDHATG
ncbi:MAG TPA: copper resistance protein CopC [Gaiellaceae bacterium]|nr:copper resistance protein CopC [Gaiellaceae bacterium]